MLALLEIKSFICDLLLLYLQSHQPRKGRVGSALPYQWLRHLQRLLPQLRLACDLYLSRWWLCRRLLPFPSSFLQPFVKFV